MTLLLSYDLDPRTGKPALHLREGWLRPRLVRRLESALRPIADRLSGWDRRVIRVRTGLPGFPKGVARFRIHVERTAARSPGVWLREVRAPSAWVEDFKGEVERALEEIRRRDPERDLGPVGRACARLSHADPRALALRLFTWQLNQERHPSPADLGLIEDCDCPGCTLRKAERS
jgi:hypothetical protein